MKKRLLLVEDDESVRGSLVRLLETIGCECATAMYVTDALEQYEASIAERPFNAIVVDGELPDGHGTQFVAELRKRHPEGIPAIIACTGQYEPENIARWTEVGVTMIHRKARDGPKALLDMVTRLVG